jgi:dipeptidyl aminopeptidase/acylaminoacyl peptidase
MSRTLLATTLVAAASLVQAQPASPQPYSGLGADSVTRETIARYAPPPLSPEISGPVQRYLDVRAPSLGRVAPDGSRLYFNWSVTGTPGVWRLDAPLGFPMQMTGGEDPTSIVDITPDGKMLVLSRDHGGEENPGLYLQPADGGALVMIHHVKGTRAFYGFTTKDSSTIYYAANDVKPDSYALYRYDLRAQRAERILDDPGLWSIADHDEGADGTVRLLLSKSTGALTAEFHEWSSRTRALKPVIGQDEKVEYDVAYAAKPDEFVVRTNKLGEFRRLYRFHRGGTLEPIGGEERMDVDSFGLDTPRRRLYVQRNDGGYTRLSVLDAKTYAALPFTAPADAEHVLAGASTPDGRYVTIGIETGKGPQQSYVWDWEKKALVAWSRPNAPEVDLTKFAAPRLDSYTARDGTKIPMFVRYPAGCAPDTPAKGEPCPVIVQFHGGPEGQARPGFSPRSQLFVDAGFVFAEPNVRGSDGYGKTWLSADDGPKRLAVITDIEDAGKELRKRFARGGKEPKVGIMGGSYGGYSTLIGMTMFAGTYDAGVSIVGISDLRTFLRNTAPYRRILRASEYGDLDRDADALAKLSPTTYLDRVKAPLLIIQGVDDPRVPAGEAIQIQEALAARGTKSRLILLEGEGHGAARRTGQVVMLGQALQFLIEQLGPHPAAG